MRRRRRVYHPRRRAPAAAAAQRPAAVSGAAAGTKSYARRGAEAAQPIRPGELRVLICGAVFILLVALKLALPDNMASARAALGRWLVRDADFTAAFSAVGRAVSGEGGVLDSVEDAYVAVFGESEATEVSKPVALETADADAAAEPEPAALADLRDLPAHAVAEQRVLGFAYAAPLAGEATSDFGWREHPTTGREAFHYGVDLAAEEGTAVACFADGTVGVTAESVELGKYVTVHHARGVTTLYAHLSRVSVSSGDTVRLGDTLGEVGSTGNATGPHLHFEVHDGEDYLNPQYYL